MGGTSGTCDNGVPTWHDKLVDMCMEGTVFLPRHDALLASMVL